MGSIRDYIVLNGKKSNLINGLIIQELPPITKPLMRTEVSEIDGRDGDIVTLLGYSAYDKEISIGLYDEYDVDEVIKYFSSEGTVIFSNEPDKYYKYQIIEQIDLEKLIRFKTAKITFHVQPFKYSAVQGKVQLSKAPTNNSLQVFNSGNTKSKPVYTILGTGVVSLFINGNPTVSAVVNGNVKLDVVEMEAYTNGALANRVVTGDYDTLMLDQGMNTITWVGNVTDIIIEQYSRWI